MKKKLMIVILIILILTGCSGKKETKETVTEKDPLAVYYGTWRTSGVYTDGTLYTIEQLRVLDADDAVDFIIILNEKGTGSFYIASTGEWKEGIWKASDHEGSIMIQSLELNMENGELVYETEGDKLYLAKISNRQDKGIVEELMKQEEKEISVPEETIVETTEPEEEEPEETVSDNTIRPEVKEAIDAYEEFVDEYIVFIEKYAEADGSDMGMLMDYMDRISRLEEQIEKMDALEEDLTDAETWYFVEVMNRCSEKLMKVDY